MKKIILLAFAFVMLSCSQQRESVFETENNDVKTTLFSKRGSEIDNRINIIMRGIESTVVEIHNNGDVNGLDLTSIFSDALATEGYGIHDFDDVVAGLAENEEYASLEANILNTSIFDSENDYLSHLNSKYADVSASELLEDEKQMLVNTIDFQKELVFLCQELDQNYSNGNAAKKGWWQRWGKCAAGILGGQATGATLGCAGVGLVGGLVGAVGGVAGSAIGALAGCALGAVGGSIGGGLTGSAMFCG